MIDTVALKNNILELAFRGDLVSSIEGDVAISDLISSLPRPSNKRIGLLKKGSDTVFPYDLPDNWDIVPLGKITSYGDTPTKIMASDVESDTWILELEDIEAGGRLLKKTRVGSRQAIGEKTTFKCGQVLYSKLRPYLKKVLQADENGICTPELIAFDVYAGINPRYVMYYLICNFVDKVINQRSYGVKMPRVDAQFMVNLPVPIPTIAVQNKIVDIIDEAFSAIEMINNLQQQYSSDFEILKSKIIDAGIQGKLTEQLPEDGTAEELLKQIAEEKEQLIKEKKIKASKALSEITEDEIPFEIPTSWKWVRLEGLTANRNIPMADGPFGSNLKKEHYTEKREVRIIQLSNVGEDGWRDENVKYTTFEHLKTIERSAVNAGEIVIAKMMPAGRAIIVPDIEEQYVLSSDCVKFVPHPKLLTTYINYAINSDMFRKQVLGTITGVGRERTSLSKLKNFLIPIPPYAEQVRIVKKIDALLELI